MRRRPGQSGLTLVELIVAAAILALLSTMAVPLTRYRVQRDKERDLRVALREIRHAIDAYKDAADAQKFQIKVGTEGYPETLEQLVEGVVMSGSADGTKIKFLRRIPIDPMTGSGQTWRTIMEDASQSVNQSEPGIFDVRSGSDKMGLDGTSYSEW